MFFCEQKSGGKTKQCRDRTHTSLVFKDLLIGKYCSDTGVGTVRPVPDAILNNKQTYRVATLQLLASKTS